MDTPQNTSYIFFVAGENLLVCKICGETYKPKLPSAVEDFVDECNLFVFLHEDCKPSIHMDNQDGQNKNQS